MTIITWGIVALLFSFFGWGNMINNLVFNTNSVIFAVIPTVAGIVLIYLGAKRYKNWLKSDADTVAISL